LNFLIGHHMHPQLRIIFVAVTAVFAAVACSSVDNVSSAIQPAHAASVAPKAAAPAVAAPLAEAMVDANRVVPYARPDLSPDANERKLAADAQLAIARLDFPAAHRMATTPALKEMVREAYRQYNRERNAELEENLALLEQASAKGR
jgi:hypothetical protein